MLGSFAKKRSTNSTSQSLNAHEKRGVQPPPSPSGFQTSNTQASLDKEMENKGITHKVAHHHTTYPSRNSLSTHYPLGRPTQSHTIPLTHCTGAPPPILFTILATDDLLPKSLSFIGKLPIPLT